MKLLNILSAVIVMAAAGMMSGAVSAGENTKGRGSVGSPVIYVTSQGLYYDSIVLADLPMEGDFQQLVPGANGEMDKDDKYFLCPLLDPGRETM